MDLVNWLLTLLHVNVHCVRISSVKLTLYVYVVPIFSAHFSNFVWKH
jgi:hypothetical protein